MPTFKSLNDYYNYAEKQIKIFLEKAGEEVKEVIRDYIQEKFYNQFSPLEYRRTFQLLNSVTCSKVTQIGNTFQLEVYLNTDGVHYYSNYDGHEVDVEAEDVFLASSKGYHGYTQTDGRFMEEAKSDLEKGISYNFFEDFKQYLKSKGIKII